MKIKLRLHPGKEGLASSVLKKEFIFELEIGTEESKQKNILTLQDVVDLRTQIDSAVRDYEKAITMRFDRLHPRPAGE